MFIYKNYTHAHQVEDVNLLLVKLIVLVSYYKTKRVNKLHTENKYKLMNRIKINLRYLVYVDHHVVIIVGNWHRFNH
jgi:hypothetical protein